MRQHDMTVDGTQQNWIYLKGQTDEKLNFDGWTYNRYVINGEISHSCHFCIKVDKASIRHQITVSVTAQREKAREGERERHNEKERQNEIKKELKKFIKRKKKMILLILLIKGKKREWYGWYLPRVILPRCKQWMVAGGGESSWAGDGRRWCTK